MDSNKICLIVAFDLNSGISKNGMIPWKIKEDMNYFKEVTTKEYVSGKKNVIIVGKNTWKSFPPRFRGLSGRINIVVSSTMTPNELMSDNKTATECHLVTSLTESLELCKKLDCGYVFICGGSNIYKEAMKSHHIDELYINMVDADYECDNFFDKTYMDKFKIDSSSHLNVQDVNTEQKLYLEKYIRK